MDLVKQLLQGSGPVLVLSDAHEIVLNDGQNAIDLYLLSDLNQLLTQVVCELVHHQGWKVFNQHLK